MRVCACPPLYINRLCICISIYVCICTFGGGGGSGGGDGEAMVNPVMSFRSECGGLGGGRGAGGGDGIFSEKRTMGKGLIGTSHPLSTRKKTMKCKKENKKNSSELGGLGGGCGAGGGDGMFSENKKRGSTPAYMVVSRCRGIGPPSSGIVLGTLF